MKKFLALILCSLILMLGVIGCKPEPDPLEGLYDTYRMVSLENGGVEVYKNDGGPEYELKALPSTLLSQDANDYIIDLLAKLGDTLTITKDTLKFSGIEEEFNYNRSGSYLEFDTANFPANISSYVRYTEWISRDPHIYQPEVHGVFRNSEDVVHTFRIYYRS